MVQWYSPGCASVHPLNTCFLKPTRVQIPNGISISLAIFAQLTAECRYTSQWATPFPLKLPLPVVIWTPSNGSLCQRMVDIQPAAAEFRRGKKKIDRRPESSIQTVSRWVQPFLHGSPIDRPADRQTTLLDL